MNSLLCHLVYQMSQLIPSSLDCTQGFGKWSALPFSPK
ncbi:unnamed protein product [Spirodela intermedia]|uniref:Uncharacterized protein n=1 Tax=Spirodela intermedia TaxID=51605 RepID=A0A7I8IPG8_SPIIN|nr:unnamed protein product [Spirodela intermedia]CAA6659797.1 unnamed protein product [Spirodela intermedia]